MRVEAEKEMDRAGSTAQSAVTDVVIIGAGASGLMCGITAGKRGRSVVILEHTDRIGSKILLSGGGRCNFSNMKIEESDYISQNPRFCISALSRYTPDDFLSMIESHAIPYHEEEQGRLFCDRSAGDIVTMLDRECRAAGVEIRSRSKVSHIVREAGGFAVTTGHGSIRAGSLVVATGGLSYEKAGATPFGYEIARGFDIALVPCRPALVPFTWPRLRGAALADLTGISLKARLKTGSVEFEDALLFTHRGLSGPAALQLSSYWKGGDPVSIDFLPQTDATAHLCRERRRGGELKTALAGLLPKRLVRNIFGDLLTGKPLSCRTDPEIAAISDRIHGFTFTPAGTEGYAKAEVTAGGVDTNALSSKTMEAKAVPGLYFTGEVLDVTGRLGGYNLQWAWSSGFAAGSYA